MPRGVLPLGHDLLPRQTMNNIVAAPLPGGASDRGLTRRQGREKTYVLTAAGTAYSAKYLASLNAIEDCAAGHAGAAGGWVFVLRMRGVAP